MKLTDVIFTFYTPQGVPVGETDFTVQLMRPGYDQQVGVIQGETLYLQTDTSGTATVSLAPSNTPYFVKVDGPDFCSQISYRFFVIESDVPVHFQDLVDNGQLNPADLTQETIRLIIEAKLQSMQSAIEAKASEVAAQASEDAALVSENNAAASEAAAKVAQVSAANSADSAVASMNAAKASETNAKTSETNAKTSETASKASETAAKTSEVNTKASETAASGSAFTATTKSSEASASAAAAKASEVAAAGSEEQTTALKDSVEATAVSVQEIQNDMETLYNQALAIGSGWSPVMRVVADGSRYVLQVTDWTGGKGTKPATGYMGSTGIVSSIGSASDIRGAKGIDGTSFTVNATGTLVQRNAHDSKPAGFAYLATDNGLLYIRETATAGVWSPGIPFGKGDKGETGDRGPQGEKGDKGDKGDTGATGPANKLTIGAVSTGVTPSATITGTAPNQILNLVMQKGDKGEKGDTGLGFTEEQYTKLDGIEAGAQKNVATNLSLGIANATTQTVLSSTGTSAVIPQATITAAGLLSSTDKAKLNGAAPLASPSFTGTPVAPTPAVTDDSTKLATTAYVRASMKTNGMSDIFGSAVGKFVNSTGTAAAPYDNADTFPVGTRVLATRSFVSNLPGVESIIYVETIANYQATQGRLQFAQGYTQGGYWMRWTTSSNVYGSWQKFLMESGGNMEGQLGVLNQAAEDRSSRAANTSFVHGSYEFYGVSQAITEARTSTRLSDDGAAATADFNAMTGTNNGGSYTLSGTYTNGPGGTSSGYTGVLEVVRRAFGAGAAVNQWVYLNVNNEQRIHIRTGALSGSVWVWSDWEQIAYRSSNVASATKLQTARKITVGNTTKTFDGTADITFSGSDIGISGPNILFNTDFLNGYNSTSQPNNWVIGGTATTGRVTSLVPYEPGNVKGVTRKAFRAGCSASNVNQYIDVQAAFSHADIPCKASSAYTLSVKFRGTVGAEYRTYIQYRNSAGTVTNTINGPAIVCTGDWQFSVVSGVSNPDAISVSVIIGRLARTNNSTSAMWMEVAEPMLQEGTIATPYQVGLSVPVTGKAGGLVTGTDWDTLIEDGDFQTWASNTSYTNAPNTPMWGMLRVRHNGTRVVQEFLTDTAPYVTWNRLSKDGGNTWTAWVSSGTDLGVNVGAISVAVTSSDGATATIPQANTTQAGVMSAVDKVKLNGISAGATVDWKATPIVAATDLNTVQIEGSHFCASNSTAASLVNCPTAKAFGMQVYKDAGFTQVLHEYSSSATVIGKTWKRSFYSPNWTDWYQVFDASSPQITTSTDTAGTNNTNIASTAFVQGAVSGQVGKSLTNANVTLTTAEASNAGIRLDGALTANVIVTIPTGIARNYTVRNATTGNFTVTLQQLSSASKVVLDQSRNTTIYTDGSNVFEADDSIRAVRAGGTGTTTSTGSGSVVLSASPALTGVPTAPTAATTTNTTQVATTAHVQAVNVAETGAAGYALKLKTARNFSVTGGATAAVQDFDGTDNVVLNVTGLNMGNATAGTLAVARGGTGATTSTGSGANVLATSPAFGGTPTAPTASTATNTTQLATTAFVKTVAAAGMLNTTVKYLTAGSFSWTSPARPTWVEVEVNGGGGAGGCAHVNAGVNCSGGGGGGGANCTGGVLLPANTVVAITVGAGGAAPARTSDQTGGNGGASSFGAYITAGGGQGGVAHAAGSRGGIGGVPGGTATIKGQTWNGGSGTYGVSNILGAASGGAGGGPGGGSGGTLYRAAGSALFDGTAGTAGGGGGGAGNAEEGPTNAGPGGTGFVIIRYYTP